MTTSRQQTTTLHDEPHPLAGQTITLGDNAADPHRGLVTAGAQFRIEDWWDRVSGGSWMYATGNPAALMYGFRTGMRGIGMAGGDIPLDDEVVYGKIDGAGHLVHVSELA